MESLLERFENIIIFDTETTGIDPKRDEIIELAALRLCCGKPVDEFDYLVKLSPGRHLSEFITSLTGITEEQLASEGVSKVTLCDRISEMLSHPNSLVIAYNAQFDLCFLYYLLARHGSTQALKGIKMLDALTIYKDRRPYPHKLCNAIDAYSLSGQNTHRAIDDAKATLELMYAMGSELDDFDRYINLFGYNPKYGVAGPKISSVRYVPQPYDMERKIYENQKKS